VFVCVCVFMACAELCCVLCACVPFVLCVEWMCFIFVVSMICALLCVCVCVVKLYVFGLCLSVCLCM